MSRKLRKSPAIVPIRDSIHSSRPIQEGKAAPIPITLHSKPRNRAVPQFELHQYEDEVESHFVRKRLEKSHLSYIALRGGKKGPVLVDRSTGSRWEGREAILHFLDGRVAKGHESKRQSRYPLEGWNQVLRAVTQSLDQRREEVRWRFLAPMDDLRLMSLDWRRAIRTTYQSGKDLWSVTQSLIQEIRSDLDQSKSPPVLVKSQAKEAASA